MARIGILIMLALIAGGCRHESFDDQWQRKNEEASRTAGAMERDMQARLRVAQQAGYDVEGAASSGP